ncbi:MAG: hypothetical protein ACM3JE_04185 [Betaproteobacteria bacterium]
MEFIKFFHKDEVDRLEEEKKKLEATISTGRTRIGKDILHLT